MAAAAAASGARFQPVLGDALPAVVRPQVVLLTHAQDCEADRLGTALSALDVSIKSWALKARDDELSIEAGPGSFVIERRSPSGQVTLTSDDLASASVIVYRPGLGG